MLFEYDEQDLIQEFSEAITDFSSEESSEEEEIRANRRRENVLRMAPFYARRKDIFTIFSDSELIKTFRFDRDSINFITRLVEHHLPPRLSKCKRRLSPVDQVLVALQFYATGTFQSVVGNILHLSQRSVGRSIHAVSKALCHISPTIIAIPDNLLVLKRGFADIGGIPGICGAVDGSHIKIARPNNFENSYVNRKGYHSINVQGVCDSSYRFISVTANSPGSVHDSTLFKASGFGQKCADGYFGDGFILGDSGYPCTPYLITPFASPSSIEEEKFNVAHKSVRCIIERTFGIWKRRFHCLHGELRVQPGPACKIIVACGVLHNIAVERKIPLDEEFRDAEEEEIEIAGDDPNLSRNDRVLRQQGFAKRARIAHYLFSS